MLRSLRARGDETLYARARPQEIELVESYSVEQEISRNPWRKYAGERTGQVKITVPYDGRSYFTRQAAEDVERALGARGAMADRRATIGHLLFVDHTKAIGLRPAMRMHNQTGAIPLRIPVTTADGSLDLVGDRQEWVAAYDYVPDEPPFYPIDLDVQLHDRDSLNGTSELVDTLVRLVHENPSAVIEEIRQEARFSSDLLMRFVVSVPIPVKAGYWRLTPVVKSMSIESPTLTSLRRTELYLRQEGAKRAREGVVRYNPEDGRLEWGDVPMRESPGGPGKDAGTRFYRSDVMVLRVGYPGEFFKADELEVKATVEIEGYLLSGLEAHSFHATGRRHSSQPKHTTELNLRTVVFPADVFAKRMFSPYQQFVFDDIIPDEMRITDLVTVLRNAGFEVESPLRPPPQDPQAPTWLLYAKRSHGPDDLFLLFAVEGKRYMMDREQLMSPDTKLKGRTESGQLKVSVLGTLLRDHKVLTREVNTLQEELRERFKFHQTRR